VDLQRALRRLPRREREAVALFYLLDLAVADVADAMGVTAGTVKTLLHRGRRAMLATMRPRPVEEVKDGQMGS
jgi:RNA polymerase sigma-70 factor, ECF subfamily